MTVNWQDVNLTDNCVIQSQPFFIATVRCKAGLITLSNHTQVSQDKVTKIYSKLHTQLNTLVYKPK